MSVHFRQIKTYSHDLYIWLKMWPKKNSVISELTKATSITFWLFISIRGFLNKLVWNPGSKLNTSEIQPVSESKIYRLFDICNIQQSRATLHVLFQHSKAALKKWEFFVTSQTGWLPSIMLLLLFDIQHIIFIMLHSLQYIYPYKSRREIGEF